MSPPTFGRNRFLQGLILWLLLLWVLTAIAPFDRRDWLLENLLVFVYAVLLIITYRRFAFSNVSYALFVVFLSLHLVGAHYTYAETPLGFWLQAWIRSGAQSLRPDRPFLLWTPVRLPVPGNFVARGRCARALVVFSRHHGHSRLQCIL